MTSDDRESVFTYQMSPDEPVCTAVVTAVSAVTGADPLPDGDPDPAAEQSLEPLYTVVDPDALAAVLRPARSAATKCSVSFRYHDHAVTVHADGRVQVRATETATPEVAD